MDLLQETNKGKCAVDMTALNKDSITVQVVLRHPYDDSKVFWVLNTKEPNRMSERIYGTPKPRGWGNPGGGLERIDLFDAKGASCSFEDIILACGIRETRCETGFIDFTFERYSPSQISFLRHQYAFGHRVLTLVARLHTLTQICIEEVETGEIEDGQWFDLSLPPTQLFKNHGDIPYWSHVRRTLICLFRVARQSRKYIPIHTLWGLVFPVGKGDMRFPLNGYCLPPRDWYQEFKYDIACSNDSINLDRIYMKYQQEIDRIRNHQAQNYGSTKSSPDFSVTPEDNSHDTPTDADLHRMSERESLLTQQEEDYRRWWAEGA